MGINTWTVGHSTRAIGEFIELLSGYGIEAGADVWRFPGSRKHPQFKDEGLAVSLAHPEIDYLLLSELGGRRRPRPDSRNTVWRSESFRGYADYMETDDFHLGIERLLKLAGNKRTAVMCSELLWWRCHRALIADYLKSKGFNITHILTSEKSVPHPYTSAARMANGELSYESFQ